MFKNSVSLQNLVISLSNAIDLVHQIAVNHQQRVAYTSLQLAKKMGFNLQDQVDLMYAAVLHDIGILTFEDKLKIMSCVDDRRDFGEHSKKGADLLETLDFFSKSSNIVRYHHHPWEKLDTLKINNKTKIMANIVNLADKVDLLVRNQLKNFISFDSRLGHWIESICKYLSESTGVEFYPSTITCFHDLAQIESFWLDLVSPRINSVVREMIIWPDVMLGIEEVEQIGELFCKVIDFRSVFTSTHSIRVATLAKEIAQKNGFGKNDCRIAWIAGSLHDLGKMAIPSSIIEKKEKLTINEFDKIKAHPYFTFQILSSIQGFEEISRWAAFHHERLDGSGYPFHLKENSIPIGSRIIAISDIFSSLLENRPYRQSMSKKKVLSAIQSMVARKELDANLAKIVADNFDYLKQMLEAGQTNQAEAYSILFGRPTLN